MRLSGFYVFIKGTKTTTMPMMTKKKVVYIPLCMCLCVYINIFHSFALSWGMTHMGRREGTRPALAQGPIDPAS